MSKRTIEIWLLPHGHLHSTRASQETGARTAEGSPEDQAGGQKEEL